MFRNGLYILLAEVGARVDDVYIYALGNVRLMRDRVSNLPAGKKVKSRPALQNYVARIYKGIYGDYGKMPISCGSASFPINSYASK